MATEKMPLIEVTVPIKMQLIHDRDRYPGLSLPVYFGHELCVAHHVDETGTETGTVEGRMGGNAEIHRLGQPRAWRIATEELWAAYDKAEVEYARAAQGI